MNVRYGPIGRAFWPIARHVEGRLPNRAIVVRAYQRAGVFTRVQGSNNGE
jgi:hypothetical protein